MHESVMGSRKLGLSDALAIAAVIAGAVVLAPHMSAQVERLLVQDSLHAAVDLRMRLAETGRWWQGLPIYLNEGNAVYPPWAYLMLRALMVSPELGPARVAWAAQCAALLAVTSWAFVWFGGGRSLGERALAGSVPVLMMATWHGAGNGQLHLLPLVCCCAAVALVARPEARWGPDLTAGALFAVAMIKPTSAAPFAFALLAVAGRARPLLLAVGFVGVWGLFASIPQEAGLIDLTLQWVTNAVAASEHGSRYGATHNLSTSLWQVDLIRFGSIGALGMWGLFGLWAGRAKHDVIALLGVAGVVTRISVYHRVYDDVLLLPAALALLRMAWAEGGAAGRMWAARLLLLACVPAFVLPTEVALRWGIEGPATAWSGWAWLVIGAFLIATVELDRRARPA